MAGPIQIGSHQGPFRIVNRLGRGGMAAVFKAVHETSGVTVALKIFDAEQMSSAEFLKRARREVQALKMCSHPNIIKVHDFQIASEGGYLALEFVDGQNLEELVVAQKRIDHDRAIKVVRDVAAALAYCHARGLFHRDIKPANIMLDLRTNRAVLLDFGIVKAMNLTEISRIGGSIVGTLTYMAPEQFLGREIDGRTDIYQLGLVLARILTGVEPPTVSDLVEGATQTVLSTPLASIDPSIPKGLDTVISNCVNLDAARRYPTAHHLLEDLDRVRAGETVSPVNPPARITRKMSVVQRAPDGTSGKVGVTTKPVRVPVRTTQPVVVPPAKPPWALAVAISAAIAIVVAILVWLTVLR